MWTVEAVLVPPGPVGGLAQVGAAVLVEDAAADAAELEGRWIARVAGRGRAVIAVHEVGADGPAAHALRDRWTVLLRALIAETPDLHGWTAEVTLRPEEDEVNPHGGTEEVTDPPTTAPTDNGEDAEHQLADSIVAAADDFRALPIEPLMPEDLDDLGADDRAVELMKATHLAGCLVVAAEVVTDHLFDDVMRLREAEERQAEANVDALWVLSSLPARFSGRYRALFAQKFLVAFTDMTRRLTSGWEPLANVAQELAVRLLLDEVEAVAETADVRLPDGWRSILEEHLFEDLDHEYLYDRAYDGFEDEPDFGPPGIAPMRFEDWFVPFNDQRHLPIYAMDRRSRRTPTS